MTCMSKFNCIIKKIINRKIDSIAKDICQKANGVSYVTDFVLQEKYPCKAIINGTERFVDLGCDNGNDVKYLLDKGKSVDACDQSPVALENLERRFPEQIESCKLTLIRFNFLERRWPLGVDSYQVAIADMSLHYFLPNLSHHTL